MKKALLISDDLPEAESQENVQKIPCQSGHVDPERGGRSKSSGLTPQKHIKEQFIKKRGAPNMTRNLAFRNRTMYRFIYGFLTNATAVSICSVWGNMSTGWMRVTR